MKFGDDRAWAAPGFDDSTWDKTEASPRLFLDAPPYCAWFRLDFSLPEIIPSGGWAVDLGRIHTADEAWLNGTCIGHTGCIGRDFVDVFHMERIYALPVRLLRPGTNVLAIRVQSSFPCAGLIDSVQFGSFEELRDQKESHLRVRLWMEGVMLGLLGVTALLSALFYFLGPRQREYLLIAWLFSMLALIFAGESVGIYMLGWRTPWVQRAIVSLFLLLPAPVFLFGGIDSPRTWLVRGLRICAGLCVALFAAYILIGGLTVARRIEPFWLVLVIIGGLMLLKRAWDVRVWQRAPGLGFVAAGIVWFTVLALLDGYISEWIAPSLPFGLVLNVGLVGLVAALAGALVVRFNHSVSRMQALSRQLLATQEAERKRLAAELHNGVAPTLATVKLDLQLFLRDQKRVGEGCSMVDALSRSIEEVRTLSHELRPAVVDQLGLAAALRGLAERLARQHRWTLELDIPSTLPVLSPEATVSMYRMAQEALYNVVHHAEAHAVWLALRPVRNGLELCVRDDGQGCDPDAGDSGSGIGWLTLRERTSAFGGNCRIHTRPGHGLELTLWIPLI